MEAGLETRFDGNPLHFRILTGYAGLCRQQCPLRGRGEHLQASRGRQSAGEAAVALHCRVGFGVWLCVEV